MKDLLGGKGAGLAEMTNAGLPVPPGFTISTEVCTIYYKQNGKIPAGDRSRDRRATCRSSRRPPARRSGRPTTRCSSRSARARSSRCPGMMDTILNLGLNDDAVEGLKRADRERPLRLRQLPPLHPDVRQRRARDSEGRVRARVRGRQEGARREARHRSRRGGAARGGRRATSRSCRSATGRDVPAGSARAARRWRATRCSAPG